MGRIKIKGLKVHQWLSVWDDISFGNTKQHRRQPKPYFYLFRLSASALRALSGIRRRVAEPSRPRAEDLGIQRRHEERRSEKIWRFVEYGFPLSEERGDPQKKVDLRNPGWLPTAIVVNIVGKESTYVKIEDPDMLLIKEEGDWVTLELPEGFDPEKPNEWQPHSYYPLEVIDGQHRLWAFEGKGLGSRDSFELPVVAFHDLDVAWQAYLFWTINITPKRISPSLAFDLYPLLRTASWMEESGRIYRQARAQELVEIMWRHPQSPWRDRINMLGASEGPRVTQAAWVRALVDSYLNAKRGLLAAPLPGTNEPLGWARAQQAAFLLIIWKKFHQALREELPEWLKRIQEQEKDSDRQQLPLFSEEEETKGADLAFISRLSLINTDQGVRGFLRVTNDLLVRASRELKLEGMFGDEELTLSEPVEIEDVEHMLGAAERYGQNQIQFISNLCRSLARFDWRTSEAQGLSEEERNTRKGLRGSGGYRRMRELLLEHLSREVSDGWIQELASTLLKELKEEAVR